MVLAKGFLILYVTIAVPLAGAATVNRAAVTSQDLYAPDRTYRFNPRDGWETVSVANQRYRSTQASSNPTPDPTKNSTSVLKRPSIKSVGSLAHFFDGLAGSGKSEPVTATWYTGHDLLNPSCWSQVDWAPTDRSFVAAVTEDGWKTKPKCFDFLQLCNQDDKCTFVRVVDTCAGCAKGSKHVDLTQAAFERLGSLELGVMTVQMRGANRPEIWNDDLWGPEVN
ncbi:hypothetical protein F5I97DRAFT_902873 [Phlebopus sp. FC_14]|nr:hypothetical protein F5I97DRAFT_902873 [Phlebopus sp. FC_14]